MNASVVPDSKEFAVNSTEKFQAGKKLRVTAVKCKIRADGTHYSSSSNTTDKAIYHNQTTLTSLITKCLRP
jgi:hypothetical protein